MIRIRLGRFATCAWDTGEPLLDPCAELDSGVRHDRHACGGGSAWDAFVPEVVRCPPVRAGAASGLIRSIEPASYIIREIISQAEDILKHRTEKLLGG